MVLKHIYYVNIYMVIIVNLVKEKWNNKDGKEFIIYLESLKDENKIEWTKKIVNTKKNVLAIKSPVLKNIVKEIRKGNYLSFLDLNLNNYLENNTINGELITYIKDFDTMKKYLSIYSKKIDNWASCDLLSFNIKGKEDLFLNLSNNYIKSDLPFERRLGLLILFKFIDNDLYINKIFDIMNLFYNEEEYYVNMINAWLLCECFIKRRDKTIIFLDNNKLNKFTINKAISKCRDSYRVSKEDKELLLQYKQ